MKQILNLFTQICKDKSLIKYSILFIVTFAIHQFVFIKYDIYFILKRLDIPMHLWTSFLIANILLILVYYFLKTDNKISFRNILVSYLLIFIIGVAWEYYEFRLDMMHGKIWAGLFESLKDMLNNTLGFVAAVLNLKFKNSKN